MCEVKAEMQENSSDNHFLMFLCFIVDNFESVYCVILAVQEKEVSILYCHKKLKG